MQVPVDQCPCTYLNCAETCTSEMQVVDVVVPCHSPLERAKIEVQTSRREQRGLQPNVEIRDLDRIWNLDQRSSAQLPFLSHHIDTRQSAPARAAEWLLRYTLAAP